MDSFVFYNCAPPDKRPRGSLAPELEALLAEKPLVLGLAEAIGYRLPVVKGYRLVRDTSKPGRANVAAYVRADVALQNVRWTDLHHGWPRTDHPGAHDPRSFVTFDAADWRVTVAHTPPTAPGAQPARDEAATALVSTIAPWKRDGWADRTAESQRTAKARKRVLLMDANEQQREIADRSGGLLVGASIDCGVLFNATCVSARYVGTVGGVRLRSDHRHALVFRAKAALETP